MSLAPFPTPFHVADLNARGELLLEAEYPYQTLEQVPLAADMIVACATQIWRSPEEFELNLPGDQTADGIHLRWWACGQGAGLLTVRCNGDIASLSVLVSGLNPDDDSLTLQTFQNHLLQQLHDTGSEPAFALLELPKRPLLATTLLIPPATKADQFRAAMLDRCFAAAYFRHLGLV